MKRLLLAFLFLAFAAPAGAQVISGLSYTVTDTTIVGSWTTDISSNSNITCGGKNGIDNGIAPNSTSHLAIVTGLSASTLYSCTVTSGSTTSSPSNQTTNAAPTRTPITSVSFGATTIGTVHGDTIYTFVSNDNNTYNQMDDGFGWPPSGPNAGANMQLDEITNESTFQGSTINLLTNYGASGTTNGTDGPSGAALSNKAYGIFGFSGNLFMFQARAYKAGVGHTRQQDFYGNIMQSQDHGATWNSWQAPAVYNANGVPPSPLGSSMFTDPNIGAFTPVIYGVDDGTIGYNATGNQIDGANGWVYIVYTDGYNVDSNALMLMRISRIEMQLQSASSWQWWVGPVSPTPTDFVNDANWSTSETGATVILNTTQQTGIPSLVFVPAMNYYLLLSWYRPDPTVTSNSVWQIMSGPTPAGPWRQLGTKTFNPSGEYNPVVMHRTVASNVLTSNIPLTVISAGDFNVGYNTYYYPTRSTLTLNPPAGGSLAFVQSAVVQNTGGVNAVATIAYGSNTTGGNLLVVIGELNGAGAAATAATISDTLKNTWTPVWGSLQSITNTPNVFYQAWYTISPTGGADTATISWTDSVGAALITGAWEFSGFTNVAQVDVMTANTVSSGTAMPALSFVNKHLKDVMAVLTINNNSTSQSPSAISGDFTLGSTENPSHNSAATYSVKAAAGTYSFSGTWAQAPTTLAWALGVSISSTQSAMQVAPMMAGP